MAVDPKICQLCEVSHTFSVHFCVFAGGILRLRIVVADKVNHFAIAFPLDNNKLVNVGQTKAKSSLGVVVACGLGSPRCLTLRPQKFPMGLRSVWQGSKNPKSLIGVGELGAQILPVVLRIENTNVSLRPDPGALSIRAALVLDMVMEVRSATVRRLIIKLK